MSEKHNDEILEARFYARTEWLDSHGRMESDVMTDEKGEYVLTDGDFDFERLYLPNEISNEIA